MLGFLARKLAKWSPVGLPSPELQAKSKFLQNLDLWYHKSMPFKDPEKRREYQRNYMRDWYANNKATQIARVAANKERLNQKVADYKLAAGCTDCGYKAHAEALDFDHIGDKTFTISKAGSLGYSWKRILTEIEKCEVVCANCHRVRIASRRI